MLRIGQRVLIDKPLGEMGKVKGTIIDIEIRYAVRHDDGFTFWYEAKSLKSEGK